MNTIAKELDQRLRQLDPRTAERVERLIRDALALAGSTAAQPPSAQWPSGYFERTAGALAGERLDRPQQGALPVREDW